MIFPVRNVWCQRYPSCLDQAVKEERVFSCHGCEHETNQDRMQEEDEITGCCLLLAALFRPEVYQKYVQERMELLALRSRGDLTSSWKLII